MKKIRLIINNKARCVLFLEYKRCGQKDVHKIQVKKRKVLKLIPGHHILSMGYECANLEISSGVSGIKDHEVINSIANPRVMGVKLLVNNPGKRMKLRCAETPSVATIIEKLA